MGTPVNLIVTCANRKTLPVPPGLCLRSITTGDLGRRYEAWRERLQAHDGPRKTAQGLYAGDHWAFARAIDQGTVGFDVRLWVCSAGYGVVNENDALAPYGATFAKGQDDSIARGPEDEAEAWWSHLITNPILTGGPRSLTSIAKKTPSTPLLVVVSPPYLAAIKSDALGARDALLSPSLLTILTSKSPLRGPLTEHLVMADAALQGWVGGSRQSLNVRLAATLMKQANGNLDRLTATSMSSAMSKAVRNHGADSSAPTRSTMTDEDVIGWIKAKFRTDPTAKKSPLLAQLRKEGHACEQGRFSKLFNDFQAGVPSDG